MPPYYEIRVAARGSPLSKVQVQEVLLELQHYHPQITFAPTYVTTTGDIEKTKTLRGLEKTNFFTKEIDALLLEGACQIAIHSAKDLPDPLPQGLTLIALTKGVDPSDSLVFKQPYAPNASPLVATSSIRREECVKKLYPHARFVDIRGAIHERLAKLEKNEVEGVVIAEAALLRLKLTHLKRKTLPGETALYQGRLAVIAREGDAEMRALFAPLNTQEKVEVV